MMKPIKLIPILCATMLFTGCFGGSETDNSQQNDSTATKAEGCSHYEYSLYGDDNTLPSITADIQDGKVFVQCNEEQLVGVGFISEDEWRIADGPIEVETEGTEPHTIYIGDIGQDYNPILCIAMADGTLEILCLFDAIRTGDFFTSGPMYGYSDIVEFGYPTDDVERNYVTIMAKDSKGKEKEIELYLDVKNICWYQAEGDETICHTLRFTTDWKMTYEKSIYPDQTISQHKGSFGYKEGYNEGNQTYVYTMTELLDFESSGDYVDPQPINIAGEFNVKDQYNNNDDVMNWNVKPIKGLDFGIGLNKTEKFGMADSYGS